MREASHCRAMSSLERLGAVLCRIVVHHPLFQVYECRDQGSTPEQSASERPVSPEEKIRIPDALGEMEQLFRNLLRSQELSAIFIKRPESKQHTSELRGFSHFLAQPTCLGISVPHLWSRK